MDHDPPRSAEQRRLDALASLRSPQADVWVATASAGDDGAPLAHLVPLSLAWLDERVVIAVRPPSRTARNLPAGASARLAVGPTRDVMMIDAVVEDVSALDGAPGGLADRYARQAGWDPRLQPEEYVLVTLRPSRIQAWREENELPGRTLMHDGQWLV